MILFGIMLNVYSEQQAACYLCAALRNRATHSKMNDVIIINLTTVFANVPPRSLAVTSN